MYVSRDVLFDENIFPLQNPSSSSATPSHAALPNHLFLRPIISPSNLASSPPALSTPMLISRPTSPSPSRPTNHSSSRFTSHSPSWPTSHSSSRPTSPSPSRPTNHSPSRPISPSHNFPSPKSTSDSISIPSSPRDHLKLLALSSTSTPSSECLIHTHSKSNLHFPKVRTNGTVAWPKPRAHVTSLATPNEPSSVTEASKFLEW
ncbi:hypothetical protein CIPAW_02G028300 [Carya illinoinensis]|uniref:Uncharacterized protein n=1 Tax=Carya illinoinensis TaxID=32201 RepID=A0A8T1RA45_CARIL|nr:hypothetical protein CIPAW_02G028300 [Carya illinoinensis]